MKCVPLCATWYYSHSPMGFTLWVYCVWVGSVFRMAVSPGVSIVTRKMEGWFF